ncbi:hypothetical protein ColLi_12792 [Colletotrichum liriopes]|uniref:DUF4440 domain-containing protein n=1 Tax=Colletotrichum liriopes TaxID=708192 RepID=A0AA37GZ16_9PEZI|nr:hypothetical protein ColLi_12792 [Colletotrichum liriopes]
MGDEENSGSGTIYSRNKEDTLEAETLLWRAMCDTKPKHLKKYLDKEAVLAHPGQKPYSPKSKPTLQEFLDEDWEPWTAYKMHDDPEFVEIDVMSSSLVYRVTAWRQKGNKLVATEGICNSVWKQEPGGEWTCCCHHMSTV